MLTFEHTFDSDLDIFPKYFEHVNPKENQST